MAIRTPLSLISSFPFSSKSHSSLSHPSQFSTLFFQPKTLTTQSLNLRFRNDAVASAFTDIEVGEDLPFDYGDWLPKPDPKLRRRAGILLHPTSFRGPYGIGDLGEEAFRFIDWLHLAGCSVWQVLPLVPPDEGGSPYAGQDANCGNTLLISLEELVKDGLLTNEELPQPIDSDRVNYSIVATLKDSLINKAAERLLLSDGEIKNQLEAFRRDPIISSWLEDSAYFAAIDDSLKAFSWYDWPEPLKNRHLAALENIYQEKKDFIDLFIAKQFLFQRQWQKLRNYAQMKGVSIMGDMPIYVGYHSADVWANKKHFLLNRHGYPMLVSGVPPDAFSDTGQLWGSPLYDWKAMEKDGFSWWIRRIRRAQNLYGEFRIDHFRGFAGFWAVPSEAKVAMVGRWKVGPRKSLFDAISRTVGKIDIIAEDLGVITEDVTELRKYIGAPGMAVLQFGFGSDSSNPHLPHNHEVNQVVYTGTHDNDTIKGWWNNIMEQEKSNVFRYLHITEEDDISWALIEAALSSVAQTTVITMQDVLGLGNSARMNIPATEVGNWSWRIPSSMSFDCLETEALKLRDLLCMYGRM
ncbi:Glycoside hydrolase, family 77 [Corchorus capsularis]|uniref:4-alpha-glucanotransferase n=1 Tax=Corchorus capsularis TaxID=210143 RepID=A0A1R3KX70_COCAP|nr:Glycoside hydrolase, family 77 [Corchorus capsularis]